MIGITNEQVKNAGLSEFENLMVEISKLSPQLIRRVCDITQGIIIGSSTNEDDFS